MTTYTHGPTQARLHLTHTERQRNCLETWKGTSHKQEYYKYTENNKEIVPEAWKGTSEHPRLIASIPTDPVPLYKSNQRPGLKEAGQPPAT